MADAPITGPAWIPAFLETLARTRRVNSATEAAGVTARAIYFQRNKNLQFAAAWDAALEPGGTADQGSANALIVRPVAAKNAGWQTAFLNRLAETSNVTASATDANVPITTVYKLRRANPGFAVKWRSALYEGYEHLEMEVLAYLRGNLPDKKIDVANAIRQLAAHRKTVAEMRAIEEDENEQEVLDSIDRVIDEMKAEWAAAEDRRKPNG